MTQTKNRACTGKLAFLTETQAKKALKKMIEVTGTEPTRMVVYKCRHCKFYHFGHIVRKN